MIDLKPFCGQRELSMPFSDGGATIATNEFILVRHGQGGSDSRYHRRFSMPDISALAGSVGSALPELPDPMTTPCPACLRKRNCQEWGSECIGGKIVAGRRWVPLAVNSYFDVRYLRMLAALPEARVHVQPGMSLRQASPVRRSTFGRPMYFTFSEGDGLLMPGGGEFHECDVFRLGSVLPKAA